MRNPTLFLLTALAALLLPRPGLHAGMPQPSEWILQFPIPFAYPMPDWLDNPTISYGMQTTTLSIPVIPPSGDAQLAVTAYFIEQEGGILRALWSSAEGAERLSSNLYEGVGGPHKRTLLLDRDILSQPGVLSFVASGNEAPLYQIEFEWLEKAGILAADPSSPPPVLLGDGRTPESDELHGEPYSPSDDTWSGFVVSAPLTRTIERLDGGMDFIAPLEKSPDQARLAVWMAGPPVASEFRLYVNGNDAGPVAFHVPALEDDGYYENESGVWFYAGWRKGTASIPKELLLPGDNLLEFTNPDPFLEFAYPTAVKDIVLQLRYLPDTPEPTQSSATQPARSEIQFLISEPDLLPLP